MSYLCTRKTERTNAGAVVQLVRILACHARGRGFESRPHRKEESFETLLFLFTKRTPPPASPRVAMGIAPLTRHRWTSVHLLKDLVRPCMGGSNYNRLVATSAVHYTPRPWEGQGGRVRSRDRNSGGRTHLLHRPTGGILLQHGQEQACTLPQGIPGLLREHLTCKIDTYARQHTN